MTARARAGVALLAAAGLAACAGVESDLRHAEQGGKSAAATAAFVAEAWGRGEVEPRFARLAFEAARQRVEKDRLALAARAPESADQRVPAAIGKLEAMSAALAALA